jgi:hypothetical protein
LDSETVARDSRNDLLPVFREQREMTGSN